MPNDGLASAHFFALLASLIAAVFALVMMMPAQAFAQTVTYSGTGSTTDGKITVSNASQGQTYTLYKLFDASHNTNGAVAYTLPSGKTASDFANNAWFQIVSGTDANVEAKTGVDLANTTKSSDFATWAKSFGTKIGEDVVANSDGTIEWDNIPYGYYYIETSLGSLVTVNSANPTVTVQDKNTSNPAEDTSKTITKVTDGLIKSEVTGAMNSDKDAATAKIGDTVSYQVTFTATNYDANNAAQTSYTLADASTGLGVKSNIVVTVTPQTTGASATTLTAGTDYTITTNEASNLTINIPWANTTTADDGTVTVSSFKYASPATVTVTYEAALTAVTGTNKATVTSSSGHTSNDETKVYTAGFELTKVDSIDSSKVLSGAEFELYDTATPTANRIYVVQDTDADGNAIAGSYTVTATQNDVKIVSGTDGEFTIKGLKQGTNYELKETKAPDGYQLPNSNIPVTANATVSYTANVTNTGNVTNTANSSALPSTGGAGTIAFTVIGGALVLGAGVALITRKRIQSTK